MARKIVPHPLDRRVGALAARQHGVVTRSQLRALGVGESAIDARGSHGPLFRVYRGVYAVGHPTLTDHGRSLAAVLACGAGAALSHASAAALWGLRPRRGPRVDVTVPRGGGRARRGVLIVHRAALEADEVGVVDAIPVTTPARTLLDLADILPRRALERVLDEAHYLRLDLRGLEPRHGRRGAGRLRAVLDVHEPGTTRTRSVLEERMLALCRRFNLPRPEVNVELGGKEVDFRWPEARLIVETDGWAAHGTRTAFERDRRRDAEHAAAGWRVMRFTDRALRRDPAWVAARVAEALRSAEVLAA
jgi:very-short-patch-repair endonuclease